MFTMSKAGQRWLLAVLLLLLSPLGLAQTLDFLTVTPTSSVPGAAADYRVVFRSSANNAAIAAGSVGYRLDFPDSPTYTIIGYGTPSYGTREGPDPAPYPAYTTFTDRGGSFGANNVLDITLASSQSNTPGSTWYDVTRIRANNPAVAGFYPVQVSLINRGTNAVIGSGTFNVVISNPISAGVKLDASPAAPLTYAREIIATTAAPVTLANPAGDLNLSSLLSYNFSSGEVRYARFECGAGLQFNAGSTALYDGSGSASLGAINGLGSSVINFSITANNSAVVASNRLVITGQRTITGTQDVTCTYSLYDQPSQAAAGGSSGRLASVTGAYITFASSTVFTATSRSSVADVEADPAYSAFLPAAPTTATTAALARLTYARAAPAPRKADGNAIALVNLHATGASGTRIVVDGDFTAAANADGSYAGAAPARVYLSANNSTCVVAGSTPAATLSASQASFNVGASATDRMLCFAPRTGAAIPASDYTATLDGVSASPAVYAVGDLGPRAAGSITRNGTQLQAPLVQLPGNGWLSRMVLTNTGSVARPYTVTVLRETGSAGTTANLTGTVPAKGTVVVDLSTILPSFSAGAPRATLNVTVAGPDKQIQGLYQIVNANSLSISNHVMVRPGTN